MPFKSMSFPKGCGTNSCLFTIQKRSGLIFIPHASQNAPIVQWDRFPCFTQDFFLEDPDKDRPVRFPLQEANVIGLLHFRVIWMLNTFLRNCFYSDCQFSAWEVYDQIVSGGLSWDSFHHECLRTFSGVC